MEFRIAEDIELVQHLRGCTLQDLAAACGTTLMSFNRWMRGTVSPSPDSLAAFYNYAFSKGIYLNRIKAQLYEEDMPQSSILLFHGSKAGIDGNLRASASRPNNDFGQGFYCGESLEQSAMFVHRFPDSCLYMLSFSPEKLRGTRFSVDQDWMLTIALFRGRVAPYESHPHLMELKAKVASSDYIVAPIADNRMYETIDSFIDGEITDEQCRHCLSSTDLGNQYVLRTQAALEQATLLEKCFLCPKEKAFYGQRRDESTRSGLDKAKAVRRLYRGKGRYIDEVLA